MTPVQLLFILVAAATLGSGLMVVSARNLVHAALWLIAALFGVAILYGLLNAGFLAVVQVVVYIGAIAILMIFAIMLTRNMAIGPGKRFNSNWAWAALVSVVLLVALFWILSSWSWFSSQMPAMSERAQANVLPDLGAALVSPNAYVLPFELASVLLLAALIGAIIVAWERS